MISFVFFQKLRMELDDMHGKVEACNDLADDLIKNHGEHCQATVQPKVDQLNRHFDAVAQRITDGQVSSCRHISAVLQPYLRLILTSQTYIIQTCNSVNSFLYLHSV